MDKVAGGEESSSSGTTYRVKESFIKKWRARRAMIEEERAEKKRYRDELREEMTDAAFVEPETFGDKDCLEKLSDSLLRYSVVSIVLLSGDVMVYICMLRNRCMPQAW